MPILWILKSVSLVNIEKNQSNSHVCNSPFHLINKKASKQISAQKFYEQQFLFSLLTYKKKSPKSLVYFVRQVILDNHDNAHQETMSVRLDCMGRAGGILSQGTGHHRAIPQRT